MGRPWFIHFGLYSELGGVWTGERVTRGYSEQIRRYVPATREEYAAVDQIVLTPVK